MWMLLRLTAIGVLIGVGLLLTGQGEGVLDVADRAFGLIGADPAEPRTGAIPSSPVAMTGLAAGGVAALLRPLDRLIGQLVTLLHELGHTIVAAALGARPAGIVLRHDASGHATARWTGRTTPVRRLALGAVAFAGLPAAAAVSAAGAQLLQLAGPEPVLWSFAAGGVVVALLARSPWSLLVAGALVGLALAALSDPLEPWVAGLVVGLLAATAVKTAHEGGRAVRRPIREGDDARAVGAYLRLPARLVQLVQVIVAWGLGAWTVWLLLPQTSVVG